MRERLENFEKKYYIVFRRMLRVYAGCNDSWNSYCQSHPHPRATSSGNSPPLWRVSLSLSLSLALLFFRVRPFERIFICRGGSMRLRSGNPPRISRISFSVCASSCGFLFFRDRRGAPPPSLWVHRRGLTGGNGRLSGRQFRKELSVPKKQARLVAVRW